MRTAHRLLLFALVLLLGGCGMLRNLSGLEEPDVVFKGLKVGGVDLQGVQVLFEYEIYNPNRRAVTSEGYSYSLEVGDARLAEGESDSLWTIEGGETVTGEVPVRFAWRDIGGSLGALSDRDRISYQLDTEQRFDLPLLGSARVPARASGQIPNIEWPDVHVAGFEVSDFNFQRVNMDIKLDVTNPNPFDLTLSALNYELEINDRPLLMRDRQEDYTLPAESTTQISIPVELSILDAGESVIELIRQQDRLSYRLHGDVRVGADVPFFDGLDILDFTLEGDLYDEDR